MTPSARRRRLRVALTFALLPAPFGAVAQEPPAPPPLIQESGVQTAEAARLDRAARELSSELRCPVCQGESIEDSRSEIAAEMRAFVRAKLAEGRTPEEVKEMLVASYGEWVLLAPRPEGFNLTVYVLPIVVLLGGAALIVVLTRRWTRRPTSGSAVVAEEDPDLAAWRP
jgi:cytochrome c-type biogenesis protein CcmH/NrfF